MRIIHLANFNSTNVGNGALISGTEKVLKEDLGSVEIIREPWDDYTFGLKKFDENFVALVNNSDGLIIGAAVTLNGQAYQKNTGTRVELPLDLWPKITKPIIFYGISYRHWPYQKYYNLPQLKKTMKYILDNPKIIFSVRNDGTKEWLESLLGYSSDKIEVIPDPALYVETKETLHPELVPGKINVVVSLNNEDEVYRFGGRKREFFWRIFSGWINEKSLLKFWKWIPGRDRKKFIFLKGLAGALEKIAKEKEINFILCPHYFDDFKIISEFIPLCPLKFPHQNIIAAGTARAAQSKYFYDLYAKADLALSMRIHSMSPAIGLGTPVIALTSQDRMEIFLQDANLADFGVDIFDLDFSDKLYQKIKFCLNNIAPIKKRFQDTKAVLRGRTRDFNLKLKDFLEGRRQ